MCHVLKRILPILGIMLVVGCSTVNKAYVLSDQAMFKAVAPEFILYVQEDQKLTDAEKELRLDTVDSWKERIETALGEDK